MRDQVLAKFSRTQFLGARAPSLWQIVLTITKARALLLTLQEGISGVNKHKMNKRNWLMKDKQAISFRFFALKTRLLCKVSQIFFFKNSHGYELYTSFPTEHKSLNALATFVATPTASLTTQTTSVWCQEQVTKITKEQWGIWDIVLVDSENDAFIPQFQHLWIDHSHSYLIFSTKVIHGE